jgi:hypothetical protein
MSAETYNKTYITTPDPSQRFNPDRVHHSPRMRPFLVGLASAGIFLGGLRADPDPLAHLRPGHPRLLLTDEGLAEALAEAKTDPLRAALHQRIIATADVILHAPTLQPSDQTAPDRERIEVYDILTCAMAYRLTGEGRFAARVKSDLLTVAAFPDWDPGNDLAIGETSFAVAIGYDWLYAQLEPGVRTTVERALLEKSLAFADRSYDSAGPSGRPAAWTTRTGNHNQVCNGGMVSAALALADEEPALARRVIAGARRSMNYGLSGYAPDGAFPEGPGYWTYGTTYSVIAFAELESALGTDLGLGATLGFAHTIDYYEAVQGAFGPVFNYADSTDDLQNSPARAWLAERYRVPAALRDTRALLAETLQPGTIIPFDRTIQAQVVNRFFALHAVWYPRAPAGDDAGSELPLDFHFRGGADIATFRSAWNDPRAIFLGFKAGDTAAGHGHLDLGSFVLDADGQRWAMDLGPDSPGANYALPGYFDTKAQRWTYFRTNNHSHNTVTPGDALQRFHAVAPIVAFGSGPDRSFAVADLTAAYPTEAASLRRGIALLDRSRVLVQDEYRPLRSGVPLRWTMMTQAKPDFAENGRSATLGSHGRTLRVDILEPASARLHLESARPPTAAESQNEGCAMLVIDVVPQTNETVMRLAVLLTPIGDRWPQQPVPTLTSLANW